LKLAARILVWLLPIVTFCSFLSQSALAEVKKVVRHEPITQQLITMVENNPELRTMLLDSIESARKTNPNKVTNPAQSLEEYYVFLDWASKAMPWSILPNPPFAKVYEQIDQGLDYFYFISDQPLSQLKDKGYFNNSLQYHEPYRTWLINFVSEWGNFLSKEGSWNEAYYKMVLEDEKFQMDKGWYEDPSKWKSYNDFFSRHLKSPSQRPIASPEDPSIVSSPADSLPQGIWKIDKNSNILQPNGVTIKSSVFKSVAVLIGEGSNYKDSFANGTLTHTFLDINDYHRYHFPISGTIKEVRIIRGDDALGGIVTWDPTTTKYLLSSNRPGWQNIETRGCVIIETEKHGLVALLPIGMSQISSVNFEDTVKVGHAFKKGDGLGYFLFGGSDIVMIFQDKVDFQITAPKDKHGVYQHVLTGEEYGKIE